MFIINEGLKTNVTKYEYNKNLASVRFRFNNKNRSSNCQTKIITSTKS